MSRITRDIPDAESPLRRPYHRFSTKRRNGTDPSLAEQKQALIQLFSSPKVVHGSRRPGVAPIAQPIRALSRLRGGVAYASPSPPPSKPGVYLSWLGKSVHGPSEVHPQ